MKHSLMCAVIASLLMSHASLAMWPKQIVSGYSPQKTRYYCDQEGNELTQVFDLVTIDVHNTSDEPLQVTFKQKVKEMSNILTLPRIIKGNCRVQKSSSFLASERIGTGFSFLQELPTHMAEIMNKPLPVPTYYSNTCDCTVCADENAITVVIRADNGHDSSTETLLSEPRSWYRLKDNFTLLVKKCEEVDKKTAHIVQLCYQP